jgi:hypothetical protein
MAPAELASWDGDGDHPHFAKMVEIIKLFDLPENPLRGRKIHWFWEPHGSWGKSMLIRHLIDFHGAIEFGGKASDMKCGMAKYVEVNGNGPPIVVLNFPRATVCVMKPTCVSIAHIAVRTRPVDVVGRGWKCTVATAEKRSKQYELA